MALSAYDYIDEVKMRLQRFEVATNIDDMQILTYLNESRHEVQQLFLSLYPEHFSKIYTIPLNIGMRYSRYDQPDTISGMPMKILEVELPPDVIDITTAIVYWCDTATQIIWRNQARRSTKYELLSITNHAWNLPTLMRQVYALDKYISRDGVQDTYLTKLYLAGIDKDATTTIFDGSDYVNLELWCTIALPYIESVIMDDIDLGMPVEGMELTITMTVMRLLSDMNDKESASILLADFNRALQQIKTNYSTETSIVPTLLPSKEGAYGIV